MAFYSLFGFSETVRFRAGSARAAWLETSDPSPAYKLELIEVPTHMAIPSPVDLSKATNVAVTGLNHFTMDVTPQAVLNGGLTGFLRELNKESEDRFDRSVRLVLEPYQQMIGREVYEIAFVSDPDGVLVEFIALSSTLAQDIDAGW